MILLPDLFNFNNPQDLIIEMKLQAWHKLQVR